jgi:hypothetical protein
MDTGSRGLQIGRSPRTASGSSFRWAQRSATFFGEDLANGAQKSPQRTANEGSVEKEDGAFICWKRPKVSCQS